MKPMPTGGSWRKLARVLDGLPLIERLDILELVRLDLSNIRMAVLNPSFSNRLERGRGAVALLRGLSRPEQESTLECLEADLLNLLEELG